MCNPFYNSSEAQSQKPPFRFACNSFERFTPSCKSLLVASNKSLDNRLWNSHLTALFNFSPPLRLAQYHILAPVTKAGFNPTHG